MKKYCALLFYCLFYACQSDPAENTLLVPPDPVIFQLDTSRDTSLITPAGTVITIPARTFEEVDDSGSVILMVSEALTKTDMLHHNLSTITENGEVLISAGMVKLTVEPNQIPRNDISVVIQTQGLETGMKAFVGYREEAGTMVWRDPQPLRNQELLENIANGATLYDRHCTVCHGSNIRQAATGPALGNVHLYRTKEWFTAFTKNSQRMIGDGDPLAGCLWDMWSPTAMPSYEDTISDGEIAAIYDYLANESTRLDVGESEVTYTLKCLRDTVYAYSQVAIGDENSQTFTGDAQTISSVTTIYITNNDTVSVVRNFPDTLFNLYVGYPLNVSSLSWHNVDVFLSEAFEESELITVNDFGVRQTDDRSYDILQAYVIAKELNIILRLARNGELFKFYYEQFKLPTVPFEVVLIGQANDELFVGSESFTPKENNDIKVALREVTADELETFLERLDD